MIKSLPRFYDEKEKVMKKIFRIGMQVIAVATLAVMVAGQATAQDPLKVTPLTPVPVSKGAAPEGILMESEPGKNFHGEGPVQRVEEGGMVIGDVLWELSPIVTYFKKSTGLPALPKEFAPGAYVGYYIDSDRVITSLWLIDPPRE